MDNSYRMRAAWRGGDGINVVPDGSRGCWHEFVTLDLIIQSRGGTLKEALYWCADFAGIPIEEHDMTPEERQEYADQHRQLELDLVRKAGGNQPCSRVWLLARELSRPDSLDDFCGTASDKRSLGGSTARTTARTWILSFQTRTAQRSVLIQSRLRCRHYAGRPHFSLLPVPL